MVFTNLIVENSEQMHWRNSFFLLELYMENWQLLLKWIPSQLSAKYLDRKFKEIYYHAIVFQQVFEYSDAYNIWKRISEILRLSFLTLCDMKIPFQNSSSKCAQILNSSRIWAHLLHRYAWKNFFVSIEKITKNQKSVSKFQFSNKTVLLKFVTNNTETRKNVYT